MDIDDKVVLYSKDSSSPYTGQALWISRDYWQSIGCPANIDEYYDYTKPVITYHTDEYYKIIAIEHAEKTINDDAEFRKTVKEILKEKGINLNRLPGDVYITGRVQV